MKKPMISVVMPVYNSGELIHQTIKSILNQTYSDFEFIIINDASKDDTLKIIKEYKKKDKRIKIINNNKNLGIALASNKGLDVAKGKYIAMTDHDDISLPMRFEKQIKYLENHKDIFLIGTGYYCIDKNNKIINKIKTITNVNKIKRNTTNLITRICHPSIMFRNKTKIRYRKKIYYAQDFDFFLQLIANNKKLSNIRDRLFYYRVHETQTSINKGNKQLLFAMKSVEFYNEKIKTGKDNYESFDPKKTLKLNIETSNNANVIYCEIIHSNNNKDYANVRKYSKKYLKLYNYNNKVMISYLMSYMPKGIIQLIINWKRKLI